MPLFVWIFVFGSAESEIPVKAKYAGDPVGNIIYIHEEAIVAQEGYVFLWQICVNEANYFVQKPRCIFLRVMSTCRHYSGFLLISDMCEYLIMSFI